MERPTSINPLTPDVDAGIGTRPSAVARRARVHSLRRYSLPKFPNELVPTAGGNLSARFINHSAGR